ncbi:MAG: hypothetical protein V1493_05995 [Candidatus Diapherotrites archaeon]
MKKEKIKNNIVQEKNFAAKALPFFVVLFCLLAALYIYLAFSTPPPEQNAAAANGDCSIEYGQYECIGGKIVVPFFNPNALEISSVKITIPTKGGTDIVAVNQPLPAEKTGAITATACAEVAEGRPFRLEWCCTECFTADMNNPSPDLKIGN